MAAAALHRAAASQLVVNDGDGFAFRHALTCEVILADLTAPDRCRLALAAAEALTAAGAEAGSRPMLLGRLFVDGGQPARAAEELLRAGRQAFAAGDFASAELLLREADRIVGIPPPAQPRAPPPGVPPPPGGPGIPAGLRVVVAGEFAQVLLQAGQPAEAAAVAARTVAAADGRDPAAATAMRLVLARAAAMTARWDDARAQLADVRRGGVADPATAAELALVEVQVALGDGRAGSRAGAEHLAAAAVGLATEAGRPELACEALETLGFVRPPPRSRRGRRCVPPGPRLGREPAGTPAAGPQRARDGGDAPRRARRSSRAGPHRGAPGRRLAGHRDRRQPGRTAGDDRSVRRRDRGSRGG